MDYLSPTQQRDLMIQQTECSSGRLLSTKADNGLQEVIRDLKIRRQQWQWECQKNNRFNKQAPVAQTLDSAIHLINHYPADSVIGFPNTYPLDSDLSGG